MTGTPAATADSERPARRLWLIGSAAVGAVGFLVVMELASHRYGFRGPTTELAREFVFGPKRGRVLLAGLVLATVGLTSRERLNAIGLAVGVDVAFIAGRYLAGSERVTYGNGPLIVLVAIGVYAWLVWDGERRVSALRGVGIGALLILASKLGDTWLRITALSRPVVLDEFVQTADHALGNPSWWVGRAVDASGSVGHLILETIYIELPLGALVVGFFQLRKGWPSHHLLRTFIAIGIIGPIFYLLFPGVGPIYAYGTEGGRWALSNVWPNQIPFDLTPTSFRFDDFTPRNCMPSLHTAWVVAIFVHSRRGPVWLRIFGAIWMVGTLLATLGFGYHYGVDLIAGVVFSLTVEAGLRDPERGWGWFRWRLLIGGSAVLAVLLFSYRFLSVEMAEFPVLSGVVLIAVLAASVAAFYASFFAPESSQLGRWGRPDQGLVVSASALP